MLRKTTHQRASMRRSKSDQGEGSSPENGNIVYRSSADVNDSKSSARVNFDFDENDNVPPPVAPRRTVVPSEKKLSFDDTIEFENGLQDIGTYVHEEIHPGIILEGYAVEL